MTRGDSSPIRFEAELTEVASSTIVRFPTAASTQLPSRGQVAADVAVNGHHVAAVIEPDGARGHWLKIEPKVRRAAKARLGDTVTVSVEVTREWPEPDVPGDLGDALSAAPADIRAMWDDITPMARWEWVRWVNATANPATRRRRVEVTISKMEAGKRRPCCFDLSSCTDPALSRSGRLIGAT